MAEYLAKSEDLTAVADAIRAKGGTDAQLTFPDGFVGAVQAITTGGVSRLTFTPAENTQSVEVPFNKVFGLFCVVVYCSDIAGSADVSRIKQFSGQKLPFSGNYTGRIDVINADGANKLANWYKKPPACSKPVPAPTEPETVKSLRRSYVSYN